MPCASCSVPHVHVRQDDGGDSLAKERPMPAADSPPRGLTVRDLAGRYRVSADKIRSWIKRGELVAINTAPPLAKPRWVIMPEALERFERSRQTEPVPKPAARRRRQQDLVDYYAD